MRLHFETEQWLPYRPELVFAFFANPENLPRLMPGWQKARIEEATFAPPPPRPEGAPRYPGIAVGDGTVLTIGFRPFPLAPMRLPWEARIEDFRWNEGFCDVQVRGPFQYWRHCHSVRAGSSAEGTPGTVLRDAVEYELPLGVLSPAVDRHFVRAQMARMFRVRQKRTAELLGLLTTEKK